MPCFTADVTSTKQAAATVSKAFLWTLLAVYLTIVIFLNIAAVNWETRALISFLALIPLTVVAGVAGIWQLVRNRRQLTSGPQVRRAMAGALLGITLVAVAGLLVGYLTA